MKILLVLMCYQDVSYCETGYWHIFFQCTGKHNMKGAWKQRMLSSMNLRGKLAIYLAGSWIPLLFLKGEEFDRGIASNTGMHELLSCWCGRG
jgi:hypothetical protein